jgi:PAS domain S-box-containing protein
MTPNKPTYEELEQQLISLKKRNELSDISYLLNDTQKLSEIGSWNWNVITNKVEWSDMMFTILGYMPAEVAGSYELALSHVHADDKNIYEAILTKAVTNKSTYYQENRICRKDGTVIHVISRGKCIIDSQGTLIRMIGTLQNIAERKQIEKILINAKEKAEESDRLKSAFLANMSHEIRTPLNGVLGFTELLKKKESSPEKKEKYLALINQEGHRLLNIINDIIDISKIESNTIDINISPCNLNVLIDNLYETYSFSKNNPSITLKALKGLEVPECIIKTDSNRIVQILSNLIQNAIKFTERGFVEFGYTHENNQLTFFVKDSGPGIADEDLLSIFGRFNQCKKHETHDAGSGLGLSIVKGLTELLGGEVRVESKIRLGSTFFITIPYENVTIETKLAIGNTNLSDLNNNDFTILIAEDEYIIYLFLEECLSDFNCTILHAYNGKEAIKMVKENSNIDFVLMDINMPYVNGYEALTAIRKINKKIPIIAQTGLAMLSDIDKIIAADFDDYITKPIAQDQLKKIIHKHLKISN